MFDYTKKEVLEKKICDTVEVAVSDHCWIESDGEYVHIALDGNAVQRVGKQVFNDLFRDGVYPEAEINAQSIETIKKLSKEIVSLKKEKENLVEQIFQSVLNDIYTLPVSGKLAIIASIKDMGRKYNINLY